MAGQVGNTDGDAGFQIAPMVDVVFVLVLFFMANAGLQQQEKELGVTLPSKGELSDPIHPPIFVEISARGQVSVNGQDFDSPESQEMPALTQHLRALMAATGTDPGPVIIRPALEARHQSLVNVLNAAGKANVKTLTFG